MSAPKPRGKLSPSLPNRTKNQRQGQQRYLQQENRALALVQRKTTCYVHLNASQKVMGGGLKRGEGFGFEAEEVTVKDSMWRW